MDRVTERSMVRSGSCFDGTLAKWRVCPCARLFQSLFRSHFHQTCYKHSNYYLENMFTMHGLPYYIKSDSGRHFVSEEFETYTHILINAYERWKYVSFLLWSKCQIDFVGPIRNILVLIVHDVFNMKIPSFRRRF